MNIVSFRLSIMGTDFDAEGFQSAVCVDGSRISKSILCKASHCKEFRGNNILYWIAPLCFFNDVDFNNVVYDDIVNAEEKKMIEYIESYSYIFDVLKKFRGVNTEIYFTINYKEENYVPCFFSKKLLDKVHSIDANISTNFVV